MPPRPSPWHATGCAATPRRASRSAAPAPACRPPRCCASAARTRRRATRSTLPLDADALAGATARRRLRRRLRVESAAPDRATYLLRPDLGRRLDARAERGAAASAAGAAPGAATCCSCIADGLSSLGVAPPCACRWLAALRAALPAGWRSAPVVVATQARVALGDEIGAALGARWSAVLIGERPGPELARQPRHLPHLRAAPGPHRRRAQLHLQHPARRAWRSTRAARKLAWLCARRGASARPAWR